jgi:hypothetical protein
MRHPESVTECSIVLVASWHWKLLRYHNIPGELLVVIRGRHVLEIVIMNEIAVLYLIVAIKRVAERSSCMADGSWGEQPG